ncbi:hypothetical protein SLS59_001353 [Nothophoma quercina]|uniref:Uncharacterized protein n=1 Tax=Nothophoma quercina TaxID=749835 RepID=A0ABR3RZI8_9PLEO
MEKLCSVYGERVIIILWSGLDEVQFIEQIAVHYDITVNAGSGFIIADAKAFVDGLSRRVRAGLPAPWLLSLSGFTNLVDLFQTLFEWNDDRDGQAIFKFMESLDTADPCWQRTIDINILEAATEHGVQAVSLQALCIFGAGIGLFN